MQIVGRKSIPKNTTFFSDIQHVYEQNSYLLLSANKEDFFQILRFREDIPFRSSIGDFNEGTTVFDRATKTYWKPVKNLFLLFVLVLSAWLNVSKCRRDWPRSKEIFLSLSGWMTI